MEREETVESMEAVRGMAVRPSRGSGREEGEKVMPVVVAVGAAVVGGRGGERLCSVAAVTASRN